MGKIHTYTQLLMLAFACFDSPCSTNRTFLIRTWVLCCFFDGKCLPDNLSIGSLLPKAGDISSITNKRRNVYIDTKFSNLIFWCFARSRVRVEYICILCNHVRLFALLMEMLTFYTYCWFFSVTEYCTITG